MPNFTPGPWNAHRGFYPIDAEPDTCTSSTDGEPFDYLTISIAAGDRILGTSSWNSRGDGWPTASSPEECRANAYLMIAATEMYAALQGIVNTLSPDDFAHWVASARAALAKADGKQAPDAL